MILRFLSLSGRALTSQHKLILTGISTDLILKSRVVEHNSFLPIYILSVKQMSGTVLKLQLGTILRSRSFFFSFFVLLSTSYLSRWWLQGLVVLNVFCFVEDGEKRKREEYWIKCSCWWQSQAALGWPHLKNISKTLWKSKWEIKDPL